MTVTRLWQDIGAGETIFTKILRLAFLALSVVFFYFLASLPLTWPQQAVCGLLTLLVGLAIARSSDSYLITLTLMIMSMFCTIRYGYWRINTTVQFFADPASHWGALDAFFIVSLLMAEAYSFLILVLGYFQCIWPLRRAPVSLPDDETEWPHIDILIPTYNEPLDVVRYTALGALNIDWPADKLHVYILDDGRRKEFEKFAHDAGIGYRIRSDNKHAKAGNINTALKTVNSPFVAIFDCDHVPTRSFLQMTMGWFLRDRKLAMLQTPHHFYSPDPFERNLQQFRIIPNEGELFYGIVQDGNDFWNATFFCGSCAILRRSALDEIGGIAVETVTEDAHTSLRMHMHGWNTAYINIPQAAGLATERLSAHVGQRIRWARGMIQILRTDNPLFARGLRWPQRLCYFNAMCHFLYAIPRLIFLSAPLIYLILSHTNVPGYWAAILAYALPHLILSNVTNSRIQGEHRHSFWNEIYETVLSPYILLPTIMALINPKLGKFNVTAKGGIVKRTFFDTKIAQPFLILLIFNIAGVLISIPRYFLWDQDRPGTVIMNVIWCGFNIVILGVCTAVAREMRQLRSTVRIAMVTPIAARLEDGTILSGETIDMSSGGASIRMSETYTLLPDEDIHIGFPLPGANGELRAKVISSEGTLLRLKFENLSIPEQEILTMVLYSRADSWLGWGESREADNVLRSLGRIFQISMRGLVMTAQSLFTLPQKKKNKKAARRPAAAAILIGAILFGFAPHARGQAAVNAQGEQAGVELPKFAPPPPGQFRDVFSLQDAGQNRIEMHGIDTNHTIYFTLPQTHVPRSAKIHVVYSFSPSLLPQISHLKLLINGTLFATIEPTPNGSGGSVSNMGSADFDIPTELMVHNNQLTIQFIGHYVMVCEDPANTTLWARIERSTYLDIQGDQLPLVSDLKELPLPFLDRAIVLPLSVPVVFTSTPTYPSIQAAGIVTSYFGMISEGRPVRFPVHLGDIPQGDTVMVTDDPSTLPSSLGLSTITKPTVAVRPNPNDPYSKVLVIAGKGGDQVIQAAQAVALRTNLLNGPETTIENLVLPPKQLPDHAPRWARMDQTISLWDYSTMDSLQGDGSAPLNVYFRLPPDIFFANRPDAVLHLVYRYNSIPIGPISSMQIRINNAFLGSVPLIPGQEASKTTTIEVPVPVVNLRPFSNSLSFEFTFQVMKKPGCNDTTPINMMGAVLRDSYLDLRGYPHYVAMPNVELFANSGFPFTRYADLNSTTVILPKEPNAQEIEMFVTMMGHFARQTGLPTLRVTVAGPDDMVKGNNSDMLVIGIGNDQPGFDKLVNNLPVSLPDARIQVHDTQGFFAPLHRAWWKMPVDEHSESGDLVATGSPDGIIEGIESPFASGGDKSIVAIRLKDGAQFEPFMHTFLFVQQASDIQGSVALLLGNRFQSFRIGANVYHVGYLPWWTRLALWFMAVPWLVAVFLLLFAFLIAIWIREWLRGKARARLRMLD
jgi:cellulose synthase (UDP-forming)